MIRKVSLQEEPLYVVGVAIDTRIYDKNLEINYKFYIVRNITIGKSNNNTEKIAWEKVINTK